MVSVEIKDFQAGKALSRSYQLLKKNSAFLHLVPLGVYRALLHPVVLLGASIKTCLVGCFPDFTIASELRGKSVAVKKEQRKGGQQGPRLRGCVYTVGSRLDRRDKLPESKNHF